MDILLSMGREDWGDLEAIPAKGAGSLGTVSIFTPPFFKLEPFAKQSCGETGGQSHPVPGPNLLHDLVNVHGL